ncbi:type II secretion system F family protein [Pseudidiomarina sp. 1ASP75-14]|uniref:type II secretion system F family protein n=1 Tax=Pseudidiomarina terrestris TaxID=2820060 RepID=UPI00264B919A|nr:type II secretion system F family protein [Pseudidiomarina sp. 1ASP75-14]MDN7138921.1 type II secretion system F family protein [Pseudidiomarina sp. 1ASP75-14]
MTTPDWLFASALGLIALIAGVSILALYRLCWSQGPVLLQRLLNRCSPTWQRRLTAYAKSQDPLNEPAEVLLRQLLEMLVVVFCLLLPLPQQIRWMILLGAICVYLQARARNRARIGRFSRQWPACLDMLAMLLQAGLSFRAALHALAGLSGGSPALVQLRVLHQQLLAGVSLDEALVEFKLRIPHPACNTFVAAVLQSRFTGGALADTLIAQAEQLRKEQQLEAERLAQEVGVKLLLPLVTCFFPVTFLLILGPIFIGFLQPQ